MLLSHSASGMDALKIEEMEKLLKEAHLERARLLESKVIENLGSVYLKISYNIVTKDQVTKFLWFFCFVCVLQERESQARKQLLDEERKRREKAEKRLQEETVHRQQLIEKEVKMRAKNFSQVGSIKKVYIHMAPQTKHRTV